MTDLKTYLEEMQKFLSPQAPLDGLCFACAKATVSLNFQPQDLAPWREVAKAIRFTLGGGTTWLTDVAFNQVGYHLSNEQAYKLRMHWIDTAIKQINGDNILYFKFTKEEIERVIK